MFFRNFTLVHLSYFIFVVGVKNAYAKTRPQTNIHHNSTKTKSKRPKNTYWWLFLLDFPTKQMCPRRISLVVWYHFFLLFGELKARPFVALLIAVFPRFHSTKSNACFTLFIFIFCLILILASRLFPFLSVWANARDEKCVSCQNWNKTVVYSAAKFNRKIEMCCWNHEESQAQWKRWNI